jgi:two-component system response regulator (stage 0 sporulation protein F)
MSIAAVLAEPHDHVAPPQLRLVGEGRRTREQPAGAAASDSLRTVLIVDDEPALRESLKEILGLQGYETVEAENGQVALQILGDRDVDVVILDLQLPKLDGVSLLHRIDPPPPVVIIHSAFEYFSPDGVGKEFGSKVFRMVRKPVSPPELLAIVSEALRELDNS